MEVLLTSTALVALAEMGDKTQLLALLLTARFHKRFPIIAGIFFATIANHALAAMIGVQAAEWLEGPWFSAAIAISFIVMGLWTLIPDKLDENAAPKSRRSAFLATLVAFFFAEIGDKTQLATVALGARFEDVLLVTVGTTAGMLLANVPVVLFGKALMRRIPLKTVHLVAAALFIALGVWMLVSGAALV